MNDRIDDDLRVHLHGVDRVPVDGHDSMAQRVQLAGRRVERRRRAGMGAALTALMVAGGVAIWNSSAVPNDRAADEPTPTTLSPDGVPPTTISSPVSVTMPPPVDGWRAIPPNPRGPVTGAQVVWTGSQAIAVGGVLPDGTPVGIDTYDPATGAWRIVSLDAQVMWPIATWTGNSLLVIGWSDRAQNTVAVQLDVVTGEWTDPVELPFGFKAVTTTPHAWTGSELLVLMGDRTMFFDPAVNSWGKHGLAPIEPRLDAASVWTGSEWLVWGGDATEADGALGDGAAFDPATDTWRMLSASPLSPRLVGGIWTGTELLITAGRSSNSNGMMAYGDGAAYDPATDTWRTLADGPAHPGFEMAWDGTVLYLFAKGGMTRYVPSIDTWIDDFGGLPFCHDATSPAWTGIDLILLGCYDGTTGGAMLTPSART